MVTQAPGRALSTLTIACALAFSAAAGAPASLELPLPADAIVIDGDSVELGGRVVDLYGIDAPELGQTCENDGLVWTCGLSAAYDLRKRLVLARGPLVCAPRGRTPTGTTIAQCTLGTQALATLQLESGMARATTDAPLQYRVLERQARDARLGIWHSRFEPPAAWRGPAHNPAPGCPIRALRGADNRLIYYSVFDPGWEGAAGSPTLATYCSDDAARRDGYRRPDERPPAD